MAVPVIFLLRAMLYTVLLFIVCSTLFNIARFGSCDTLGNFACESPTWDTIDDVVAYATGSVASLLGLDRTERKLTPADLEAAAKETAFYTYPDKLTRRHEISGFGSSNIVRCWPSDGGILVATRVTGVELEYLGLDRFHGQNRSSDQIEEDAFCRSLRRIGAKWWESEWDWLQATSKARKMTDDEKAVVMLGWLKEGGVWVLRIESEEHYVPEMGRIWNAFTMEERCRAIELSGGTFYRDLGHCDETKDLT
ncbi:hypothetical protein MMC28_005470 [Mycoblastus sanguinarius]|nr:hypothetical protein [Mycoblastus sanguinarius]